MLRTLLITFLVNVGSVFRKGKMIREVAFWKAIEQMSSCMDA